MNAAMNMYEEQEFSYSAKTRPAVGNNSPKRTNRANFGRRGKSPQSFNGMHRRRTKKIRW